MTVAQPIALLRRMPPDVRGGGSFEAVADPFELRDQEQRVIARHTTPDALREDTVKCAAPSMVAALHMSWSMALSCGAARGGRPMPDPLFAALSNCVLLPKAAVVSHENRSDVPAEQRCPLNLTDSA